MTPVMLAARGGHLDVFLLLVTHGCVLSPVAVDGNNILHMACYGGNIAIVKHIVSLDIVDISSRGQNGRTCVMTLANLGHNDGFTFVVENGGDVSLADEAGDNILHIACKGGHVETVTYILSQSIVDVNSRGKDGETTLMMAARLGYREVFDECVCVGGNMYSVDTGGYNILHKACLGGHVEMVKYVLSLNIVDVNSRGHFGRTPLMLAAYIGQKEVLDVVLSKGGDASLVDIHGDTILHLACLGGNLEIVKYVLSQNIVDVNSRGQYNRTPLMMAARRGHGEVFYLVLHKGGDASLVDKYGDSILHLACLGGNLEIVKYDLSQKIFYVNSRGQYDRTPLMMAARMGYGEVFYLVLNIGGDASLVDKYGDSILHLACLGGNLEIVKYVLSQNIVDVNSRGQYNRTPLMVAAYMGHTEVLQLLFHEGGDASLEDRNGDNMLHLACLRGHVDIVKYVLSGTLVDINARNKDGATAATIAKKNTHMDIYDLLINYKD
ncbi:ankyrin repeat domain-containing protein 50-like [Haliotis rubra]|uniref:ankyrin repeat domain-containing protein 50-like n=1 Tax=Haliotis rubra TaxID=36100 RepID=UPI001EE5A2E5|nr:ankyrin repeat domain-containing protein 50-like [Haliotis rubra]